MKKSFIIAALITLAAAPAMAQGGFPDSPADPNGVPIIESIVALIGLGGAYVARLIRKNRKGN